MKSKFSFVIAYWWVFLLLVLGLLLLLFAPKEERLSETENRMLSGFPTLNADTLLSGEFSSGFESYLSDGIFARDALVGASESLLRIFNMTTQEEAALLEDLEMADELQGIEPSEPAGTADPEPSEPKDTLSGTDSTQPEDTEDPGEPEDTPQVVEGVEEYGLYFKLPDGTYQFTHSASESQLETVSHMLNSFKSCLPEDGNVFYTTVPLTKTGLMLHMNSYYKGWFENYDDGIAKYLDRGVYYINTPALLEADLLEQKALYFTSDHHWTPLAAVKVVNECMSLQGVPTVPYEEYAYQINTFSNAVKGTSDELPLLHPLQEVTGYRMPNGTQGKAAPLINYGSMTYRAYLSGDARIWTRYITGFSTGRKALVIGDSFSNAFTPYLMPYYDEVCKVDARYYVAEDNGGSIAQMLKKYEIDDVYIIVSYANGIRSFTSLVELERSLYGK